ncbi:MAG: pilus assembly protein [Acidobacteria bacterium]|nr:MAG: pilus assembly protein [Acidobacteriota bacterium]
MAANVLVDAGFVVALLSRRDSHHGWALAEAKRLPPPWGTCEAALSEAFHLLGGRGAPALSALLRRGAVVVKFELAGNLEAVLRLMAKYADVPTSLADASLIRMTETLNTATLLTTDTDFHVYRRHGRQVIPCVMPSRSLRRSAL